MKQSHVLARTYHIHVPTGETGTAFILDVESRRYVLTARHIVEGYTDSLNLRWRGKDGWLPFPAELVGHCKEDIDISVLTTELDLPSYLLPEGSELGIELDLKLSEEIYFYGFPYGMSTPREENDTSLALVKRGIISGFFGAALTSGEESFYIDGHNNPGFSGGPVVSVRNGIFRVAGVVSGIGHSYQKVYGTDENGLPDESEVVGHFPENTGIISAHNIKHALDLIRDNPVGFPTTG